LRRLSIRPKRDVAADPLCSLVVSVAPNSHLTPLGAVTSANLRTIFTSHIAEITHMGLLFAEGIMVFMGLCLFTFNQQALENVRLFS